MHNSVRKQAGLMFFGAVTLFIITAGLSAQEKKTIQQPGLQKPAAQKPAIQKNVGEQKPSAQEVEFFESHVRPVLFEKCFSCHGAKLQQSGLRLDSREAMLKGGGGGAAITLGSPEKSPLIKAIHYDGPTKMPPAGKLSASEIEALTLWVKNGAFWPSAGKEGTAPGDNSAAGKNHWSFQPFKKSPLPKIKDTRWCKTPIDRFILARLEAKSIAPAPQADRLTLLRRASFDLTGLPPSPEDVDDFLADKSPNAFIKVVDRLLASPRYGEFWGRHWLDVARYADTKGYVFTEDAVFHNGYTYRDYVIRSFNEDLPYDKFIIQQLAADKLPLGEDKRPLAALGFLNIGRRFLNDQVLINDDRIDVTTRGIMGLTVTCARCHNHKFDPIPAKDYYSMYGVFASSVEANPPLSISPKSITDPFEKHNAQERDASAKRDALIRQQTNLLRDKVAKTPDVIPADVKTVLQSIRIETLPDAKQLQKFLPLYDTEARNTINSLQAKLVDLQKTTPPSPEFALGLTENAAPFEPYVFIRGNPGNRGEPVKRQFLEILSGPDRKPFTQGSGRLELAEAIASKDNPLTARVLINRVWMYHFGSGLVRTPGDFGLRGEKPTHPELLDWLASNFVEPVGAPDRADGKSTGNAMGWSLKKLHRMILLSSAYQQSSVVDPKVFALDPENRLIAHQNRQRLGLEALRDSLLFVSGRLDTKMGGPAVELTTAPYTGRRTVYGFIDRQNLQGLYRTFDFASPDTSSAQRFNTTVPQQALFMMNSPFVVEQAKSLAGRPDLAKSSDETERIRSLYRLLFGRQPSPHELGVGQHFLEGVGQLHTAGTGGTPDLTPWEQYIQALLMTNEFSFVD